MMMWMVDGVLCGVLEGGYGGELWSEAAEVVVVVCSCRARCRVVRSTRL